MTFVRSSHAIGEFAFLIGVPEEAGVVEAGSQNAFIAVLDETIGVAIGVGDRDELRGELRRHSPTTEKYLLMDLHYRRENFAGKVEKRRIEVAGNRRRPFGQVHENVREDRSSHLYFVGTA